MVSKAAARWTKLSYGRIPQQVGTFFEQLTRQLTRGTAPDSNIDLNAWSIDSGIEVKGGDNTHSFRIPSDQLERHAALAEFPFSNVLYFLYRYDNRLSHNGPTGLSRTRGPHQRSIYLFRRMMDLTIIDHRVLLALARKRYAVRSKALPMDPERECLILPSRELGRYLSTEWSELMTKLGFDTADWLMNQRVLRIELSDGLELHENKLPIRALLPTALPFDRIFKRQKRQTILLPDLEL
ncbi:hypothetical protein IT407_02175 [Candidatus Uhrbacteria bacterium]|nr:hypothetical protein [Candidatus Uhrbacteria bacterium]